MTLVYFDAIDLSTTREQQAEAWLQQQLPGYRFEVRNQARMHLLHGHAPYQNCADGISRWVEIPTCVGVDWKPMIGSVSPVPLVWLPTGLYRLP